MWSLRSCVFLIYLVCWVESNLNVIIEVEVLVQIHDPHDILDQINFPQFKILWRWGIPFNARVYVLKFFSSIRFEAIFFCKANILAKIFLINTLQECFWGEGEELSRWRFFDWSRFVSNNATLRWKKWNFDFCLYIITNYDLV